MRQWAHERARGAAGRTAARSRPVPRPPMAPARAPEAGTGSANTSANGGNHTGVEVDQPSSNRPSSNRPSSNRPGSNRPGLNGSEPGGGDVSGTAAPAAGVNGSGPVPGGEQRGPEAPPSGKGAPAKRHRWLPRTVRHLAELLLVGFIVEYFVVPQISGTHKAAARAGVGQPLPACAGRPVRNAVVGLPTSS